MVLENRKYSFVKRLLFSILSVTIIFLIAFGLCIVLVKNDIIDSDSPFRANDSIINLFQIPIYVTLICIWYKKSVGLREKKGIWIRCVAFGLAAWLFIFHQGFLPSTISILSTIYLIRKASITSSLTIDDSTAEIQFMDLGESLYKGKLAAASNRWQASSREFRLWFFLSAIWIFLVFLFVMTFDPFNVFSFPHITSDELPKVLFIALIPPLLIGGGKYGYGKWVKS
jgi:hypothetical protein